MTSQRMPSPPSHGLPAGVEAGPLGKRFAAQIIDLVVPVAIALVTSGVSAASEGAAAAVVSLVGALLVAVWIIIVWWLFAYKAAGPGMRMMKLQLVGLRNGRPIGLGRFFVRELVLAALTITVVGLLLMLVLLTRQPRRQGWHDLVAGSVVIKQRALAPARPPAPAAAQRPTAAAPAAQPAGVPPTAARQGTPVPAGAAPHEGPRIPAQAPPADSPMLSGDSVRTSPRGASGTTGAGARAESRPVSVPVDVDPSRPLDQGWVAVLDDGRDVEVSGLVLLGRNPQARPGEDEAELIKVADETRTVSKTHLSLTADASGLWVMDRGSTNGTTLTNEAGVSKPCPAGDVVAVAAGGIISFGDHWLKIERTA